MKKMILLAATGMLALSPIAASAQTGQPAPGASTQGNVGPNNMGPRTTTGTSNMRDQAGDSKGHVGDSKGMMPGRAGGTNTNNMENQAGGGGAGGGAGGGSGN